jgi:hypothetical protein
MDIPFLDVLVTMKEGSLRTTVKRKPTHTGRHLHYKSNHPMYVKQGVIHSLVHRANKLCHNEQNNRTESELAQNESATNAYPGKFMDSVINKNPRYREKDDNDNKSVCAIERGSTRSHPVEKSLWRRLQTCRKTDCRMKKMISIPYIRGISEKFKRIGERFNIKTVFKTKYTLGNFLRKTKPNIDTLDRSHCEKHLSTNNCTIEVNYHLKLPYICFGHHMIIIRGM